MASPLLQLVIMAGGLQYATADLLWRIIILLFVDDHWHREVEERGRQLRQVRRYDTQVSIAATTPLQSRDSSDMDGSIPAAASSVFCRVASHQSEA
jgi:hypothetical protein